MRIILQGLETGFEERVVFDSDLQRMGVVIEVGNMQFRLKEGEWDGRPYIVVNMKHRHGLDQMEILPRFNNEVFLRAVEK